MKKILSMILVVCILLSLSLMTVNAAQTTRNITLSSVNGLTANDGDEIVILLTMDATKDLLTVAYTLEFDETSLIIDTTESGKGSNKKHAFVDAEWFASLADLNVAGWLGKPTYGFAGIEEGKLQVGYISTAGDYVEDEVLNDPVGKFIFTVDTTEKKEIEFKISDANTSNLNDPVAYPINSNSIKIALNGYTGEEEEEVFEITKTATSLEGTDTMKDANGADVAAAGDKVVAIFAKNVTGAELAAESYGIIFGGKRFPGMAKVPAGASWAVKLVGSAEQLPAGKYAYGIFAAGCDDVNAGNYTVE